METAGRIGSEDGQTFSASVIDICPTLELTSIIDNFILTTLCEQLQLWKDDLFYKEFKYNNLTCFDSSEICKNFCCEFFVA